MYLILKRQSKITLSTYMLNEMNLQFNLKVKDKLFYIQNAYLMIILMKLKLLFLLFQVEVD